MALTVSRKWLEQERYFWLFQEKFFVHEGNKIYRHKVKSQNDKFVFRDTESVYTTLANKIQSMVLPQCANFGATRADLIRVLHKYVSSGHTRELVIQSVQPGNDNAHSRQIEAANTYRGVHHNLQTGAVRKEFEVNSWQSLANLMVYELKSEASYLTEIELAEMVAMSSRVAASLDAGINVLASYLDLMVTLKSHIKKTALDSLVRKSNAAAQATACLGWWDDRDDRDDSVASSYTSSKFKLDHKHYRAFVSGLENLPLGGMYADDFEKKAAVFHDLLQVVYDLFAKDEASPHPLEQANMKTQTGFKLFGLMEDMEPRSKKDVDARAKAFAMGEGRPSESGPSYTTVRVCSINKAHDKFLEIINGFEEILREAKKAMAANDFEMSKLSIATCRSGIRPLTAVELKDTVWAMFGYWSLYYRKSITTAHTFFEVREAARQCGVSLTGKAAYPTRDEMVREMGLSAYAPSLATRLRKRAFKLGLELPLVKNAKEFDAKTLAGFAKGPIPIEELLKAKKAKDQRWKDLRTQHGMKDVRVRRVLPIPRED
ncbi:hypothetical protein [Corallococcus exiguus]|uniref:hypothetical protein n=1 Tax=Corallococcus exiguus TaxID=83462 RepID=UPI001471C8AA|nr:hypothetical protein [Corallococcus exiguus]NNB88924.1 hypothetical protein [Corallococcus exiguus]